MFRCCLTHFVQHCHPCSTMRDSSLHFCFILRFFGSFFVHFLIVDSVDTVGLNWIRVLKKSSKETLQKGRELKMILKTKIFSFRILAEIIKPF